VEWGTSRLLASRSTSTGADRGLSQLPTLGIIMGYRSNKGMLLILLIKYMSRIILKQVLIIIKVVLFMEEEKT
jgi:hypothetical protein